MQTTVEALKDKLWRKTGTAVASMRLQLRDDTGAKLADLDDDAAPLAAYRPYSGYQIHVVDLDPSSLTSGGWLEDTSLVDKYKISDEAYDKLDSKLQFHLQPILLLLLLYHSSCCHSFCCQLTFENSNKRWPPKPLHHHRIMSK